jgi:diketogulonate reductase-like aldo/keto reductase
VQVASKLPGRHHAYDDAIASVKGSLERLGLDHLDLHLIHWPNPSVNQYVEAWRALVDLQKEGLVRSIGVSNFTEEHLDRLAHETDIVPAVNQVELHPGLPQDDLRAYHDKHGIATESWAPIGQGAGLLDDPHIQQIAESYGKTPAQLVLRWHLELGCIVIPKSVNPSRIAENIDVFDFELADDDRDALSAYEGVGRIGPHPDEADFG